MRTSLVLFWLAVHAAVALAQSPGTFTSTGNMTTGRYGHTATLLLDGRVLVTGGVAGTRSIPTTSAELYDPATGTFLATGNMAVPRAFHTATLLASGKVLVAGGLNSRISAELYDPSMGTFTQVVEGDTARQAVSGSSVLLANGKVLILESQSAQIFDPDTGSLTDAGAFSSEIQTARSAIGMADGRVLITGDNWYGSGGVIYDPRTGIISRAGEMRWVEGYAATLLPNGKILFTGGDIEVDNRGLADAKLFDPSRGVFDDAGRLNISRFDHTSTLLSDGTVLIAGSQWGPGALDSAELYDPATNVFTVTGSMAAARFFHTATLLLDGSVLITGGFPGFPNIFTSAEIYHPANVMPTPTLWLSGYGRLEGAVVHTDTYQLVSPAKPAAVGEALTIYLTGLMDGSVIPPQVAIGGLIAEVLSFGNVPGFVGLNQVTIRVPNGVLPGPDVPVRLNYIGRVSNVVTIGVQ